MSDQNEQTHLPLPEELRRLREAAGMSRPAAAAAAGSTQPTIWRAEKGQVTPKPELVKALCRAYGAPAELRRRLVQQAADAQAATFQARTVVRRSWRMQERAKSWEESASTLLNFCPATLSGLVQTEAYARALWGDSLPPDERDRAVAVRMRRQPLLASGRDMTIVHTDGALRWCMGSPAVMVEQMDRLTELSHLPNVHMGAIPFGVPATVPPYHGWTRYDDRAVVVGTVGSTLVLTDQPNLDEYAQHWFELEPLVVWGDDARAAFARVRADFQTLASG